jgi:hypothetical protein
MNRPEGEIGDQFRVAEPVNCGALMSIISARCHVAFFNGLSQLELKYAACQSAIPQAPEFSVPSPRRDPDLKLDIRA